MSLLSGALPLPYVPACVTRGALVAHKHSFAPSPSKTSQYRRTFVELSVFLWNDLYDPSSVFDGVGRLDLRAEPMPSCWPNLPILSIFFFFLPSTGWLCGVGLL